MVKPHVHYSLEYEVQKPQNGRPYTSLDEVIRNTQIVISSRTTLGLAPYYIETLRLLLLNRSLKHDTVADLTKQLQEDDEKNKELVILAHLQLLIDGMPKDVAAGMSKDANEDKMLEDLRDFIGKSPDDNEVDGDYDFTLHHAPDMDKDELRGILKDILGDTFDEKDFERAWQDEDDHEVADRVDNTPMTQEELDEEWDTHPDDYYKRHTFSGHAGPEAAPYHDDEDAAVDAEFAAREATYGFDDGHDDPF